MRAGAILTLLASLLAIPGVAAAHGRPPMVSDVRSVPGDPDGIVARATWGLVASEDGGETWYWICAAAYGVDAELEDPAILPTRDGSILVGSFGGLWRSRRDRCEWSQPDPDLVDVYVIDLDARAAEPDTIYAIETNGAGPDQLHVSFDAGASFDPLGPPIEEVLVERVRVAPSDSMRVYLSGAQPVSMDNPTRRAFFFRSEDGGQGFTAIEVPLLEEERNVHLLAVDPTDPGRVLVRMTRRTTDVRTERVLLTEDGGESFDTVLEAQRISGAAFSADGGTAWVSAGLNDEPAADPAIGLFRSEDGGRSFAAQSSLDLTCVARLGDEPWVCANELREGYSLARSPDGGASLEPMLEFSQITSLPTCDECSEVAVVCPTWYPDLASDLMLDAGTAGLPDASMTGMPRDGAAPAMCGDGSTSGDASTVDDPDGGDCGCGVTAPGRRGLALLFAMAMLALARRRIDARSAGSVH